MRHIAAVAVAVISLAGCGPATSMASNTPSSTQEPTSVTYAMPGCYNVQNVPSERPAGVLLYGCNSAGKWLQDMTWTAWGSDGADGSGTFTYKTCDPDCASDHGTSVPVVVHAKNPKSAPDLHCVINVQFFTDITLAFPKDVPPSDVLATNSQSDGMAASHSSIVLRRGANQPIQVSCSD